MADVSSLSVSVLCAYPVSDIYNFNHRLVYYLALAFVVTAPTAHKWLIPAAISLLVLYSMFSTFYLVALFVAPTRLGPTLDIFPVHSLLLTNTYAMAAVVFCRSSTIKKSRGLAFCSRAFVWLWGGFMLANYVKYSFEGATKTMTKTVQCHSEKSASLPANIFSAGHGLACENPCLSNSELRPILWGSIDAVTRQFNAMPHTDMTMSEYLLVILFGAAFSSTLWLNFFTSPQITRNTVFSTVTGARRDSRVRVVIAKLAALTWFGWSYFALLTVALALPFVAYIQEELLKRYPVAESMCLVKQWVPWIVGMIVALVKVAAFRARKQHRNCRRKKLNNAMRHLKCQVEHMPEFVEASSETPTTPLVQVTPTETASPAQSDAKPVVQYRIEIAKVRKINGLFDGFGELMEWWRHPSGEQEEAVTEFLPTADEEKALLKMHYEQED